MFALTSICTYPIKSCARLRHTSIDVERRGLRGDRRWLIVDAGGRFVTGREYPSLVRLRVEETPTGLSLLAPGMPRLEVPAPTADATAADVQIWRHRAPARATHADAHKWLSEYLGSQVKLVYQHTNDLRPIEKERGGQAGDHVSFADGYPLLLIGGASLADLNRRLPATVTMERFRANLIVATDDPFVEDDWQTVVIGGCEFDVAKRCSRCVFTTIDPLSGTKDPAGEPLKTLRSYRLSKEERGVMFGVNLIPRRTGRIRCGQVVEPA